jgi:hypothetical protein
MNDRQKMLDAASDSLRSVVSIRDFLTAVQVGAETAIGMLDDVERRLLDAVRTINEDFER